jgi:predicted phosphohydrolase
MALYAIGDLHLSLGASKPMDIFGYEWTGYVDKIREGFAALSPDDVCVLCGDLSWAKSIDDSGADFGFISELPGKKIILKGNHDHWWNTVTKVKAFFDENGFRDIDILHNNCFRYDGVALCGTRGWNFDPKFDSEHNRKIAAREAGRLRASLEAAGESAEKLCFFHYPPRFNQYVSAEVIEIMRSYGVKRCWYGHIHGEGHRYAVQGVVGGIEYNMVSADFINFAPRRIM